MYVIHAYIFGKEPRLVRPFDSPVDADEYANRKFSDDDWNVVPIEPPEAA